MNRAQITLIIAATILTIAGIAIIAINLSTIPAYDPAADQRASDILGTPVTGAQSLDATPNYLRAAGGALLATSGLTVGAMALVAASVNHTLQRIANGFAVRTTA